MPPLSRTRFRNLYSLLTVYFVSPFRSRWTLVRFRTCVRPYVCEVSRSTKTIYFNFSGLTTTACEEHTSKYRGSAHTFRATTTGLSQYVWPPLPRGPREDPVPYTVERPVLRTVEWVRTLDSWRWSFWRTWVGRTRNAVEHVPHVVFLLKGIRLDFRKKLVEDG